MGLILLVIQPPLGGVVMVVWAVLTMGAGLLLHLVHVNFIRSPLV